MKEDDRKVIQFFLSQDENVLEKKKLEILHEILDSGGMTAFCDDCVYDGEIGSLLEAMDQYVSWVLNSAYNFKNAHKS